MPAKKKQIPLLRRLTDQVTNGSFFVSTLHDNWIDIKGRQIWIHGAPHFDPIESDGAEPGVEYLMATQTIKNLHILLASSRKDPITIHLHTCGGVVEEGLAIYDTIRLMPYPKKIISYTHARSMSSYILQAGTERVMLPSSYFMFHDGELFVGGTIKQVKSAMEYSDRKEIDLTQIYVDALKRKGKFKNKSRQFITDMLRDIMDQKEDVYLTADQAVEWGFADKVLESF